MERCHRAVLLTLQRNILIIEFFFTFKMSELHKAGTKRLRLRLK